MLFNPLGRRWTTRKWNCGLPWFPGISAHSWKCTQQRSIVSLDVDVSLSFSCNRVILVPGETLESLYVSSSQQVFSFFYFWLFLLVFWFTSDNTHGEIMHDEVCCRWFCKTLGSKAECFIYSLVLFREAEEHQGPKGMTVSLVNLVQMWVPKKLLTILVALVQLRFSHQKTILQISFSTHTCFPITDLYLSVTSLISFPSPNYPSVFYLTQYRLCFIPFYSVLFYSSVYWDLRNFDGLWFLASDFHVGSCVYLVMDTRKHRAEEKL